MTQLAAAEDAHEVFGGQGAGDEVVLLGVPAQQVVTVSFLHGAVAREVHDDDIIGRQVGIGRSMGQFPTYLVGAFVVPQNR
ncbi:hypothetical protein [Streptomyces virginiae]|uniref:hypothetical protein n=1 Tax=Streptomyces virginiae TaxID=1961 RepID=UPI0036952608